MKNSVLLVFLMTLVGSLISPLDAADRDGSPPAKASAARGKRYDREKPFRRRAFNPYVGKRWIGSGISYGPYRDGQQPGGPAPTRAQIREDLRILVDEWKLIRVYGSSEAARTVLDVIRQEKLPMRVMLGAWISSESTRDKAGKITGTLPTARAQNRREIENAVKLANAYPEVVIAVSVGNETQVFWSQHRVSGGTMIDYVREVRARTRAPVTVADDFNFWNKPESKALAGEVDFIVTHIYAMWAGVELKEAISWTKGIYAGILAAHPGLPIVIGEAGWATKKHREGEQARLIKGAAGEKEQQLFFAAFSSWVKERKIPSFYFEAFDENWKGGAHPDEVEKHWGLFRANRRPKPAVGAEEKSKKKRDEKKPTKKDAPGKKTR